MAAPFEVCADTFPGGPGARRRRSWEAPQQDLIHHVILLCSPVTRWCRERGQCSATTATKRLLVVLD
jgi:hypothetical protein